MKKQALGDGPLITANFFKRTQNKTTVAKASTVWNTWRVWLIL
jgi:hypothetical protein